MAGKPKSTNATMISTMRYKDANAAVEWLCRAFGLKEHAVYKDKDGKVAHAELAFGPGMIMLGPDADTEFGKYMTMPEKIGGKCTQTIYVIVDDADAHHARAKAAGAEILMAPKDQDYGGRDYSARDLEGHVWSFGTYDPWTAKPS